MNLFEEHAANVAEAQATLGGQPAGGDRMQGGVIVVEAIVVPCTTSPVVKDWTLSAGRSSLTMVEQCEFLAGDVPASLPNTNPPLRLRLDKGVKCLLKLNPKLPGLRMQLWDGGLLPGGLVYRFSLVDENFHG